MHHKLLYFYCWRTGLTAIELDISLRCWKIERQRHGRRWWNLVHFSTKFLVINVLKRDNLIFTKNSNLEFNVSWCNFKECHAWEKRRRMSGLLLLLRRTLCIIATSSLFLLNGFFCATNVVVQQAAVVSIVRIGVCTQQKEPPWSSSTTTKQKNTTSYTHTQSAAGLLTASKLMAIEWDITSNATKTVICWCRCYSYINAQTLTCCSEHTWGTVQTNFNETPVRGHYSYFLHNIVSTLSVYKKDWIDQNMCK